MTIFHDVTTKVIITTTFFLSLKKRSATKVPSGMDNKMGVKKAMPQIPKRFFTLMMRRLVLVKTLG